MPGDGLARAVGVMPKWRVDLIGKKLQHAGTVEAPNEREAIDAAMKELRIEPVLRSKIVVAKVKD